MRQMTKEEVRLFVESRRVFRHKGGACPEVDVGFIDDNGDVAIWFRHAEFEVYGTVKGGFHCVSMFAVVLIASKSDLPQYHSPDWRFREMFELRPKGDGPRVRLDAGNYPELQVGDAKDARWSNEPARHSTRWIRLITASPPGIQKKKARPADDDVLYWTLREVSQELWAERRVADAEEHAARIKKDGDGWVNTIVSHLKQMAEDNVEYATKLAALQAERGAEFERLKATFDVDSDLEGDDLTPEVLAYVKANLAARSIPSSAFRP